MPRATRPRDEEIVRRRAEGQKVGRIAADLGVPVARVWRVLARDWEAQARLWQDEAHLWQDRAERSEVEAVRDRVALVEGRARGHVPWDLRRFLNALAREGSLDRRLRMADAGPGAQLPEIRALDLRSAATIDVTPREEPTA